MPELSRPYEFRPLLLEDPGRLSDPQVLTLLLACGTTRQASEQWPKKTWTAVALGEELYAAAGWQLRTLARLCLSGALDLRQYGLGRILGGRLVATLELAQRWHQGWGEACEIGIRSESLKDLAEAVCRRREPATDGELLAIVLHATVPGAEAARGLIAAYGGLEDMLRTLACDHFDPPGNGSSCYRLRGHAVELWGENWFHLLAAVELARRYQRQAEVASPGEPDGGEVQAAGAEERLLLSLLDSARPLDGAQRSRLIEVLRCHPRYSGELARLAERACEAGTEDAHRAAEAVRMFDMLYESRDWRHPSEVLGSRVPYARLLAVAEARDAEARGSGDSQAAARVATVRGLLERAERHAATGPVAECMEVLAELEISASGMRRVVVTALHLATVE